MNNTIQIDNKIVSWKISKISNEPKFKENHAPKRPTNLPCQIHHAKIKGEGWTILIGLMENRPYEIFGGLSKFIEIPKKYKNGTIVKNGKNKEGLTTYNLVCGEGDDQFTVKDIVNVFENTTQGAFSRIISLSLRHGTPVMFVVEQLQKDQHSDIISFSKVIARVLKNYIEEGAKSTIQCPQCQSNNMVFDGGCNRCLDCGNEKCS